MKILYIDTSSSFLYAGIVSNDKLLVEVKKEFGQSLSQVTLPEIAKLFKISNLNPNDIDKIIVVNGPGSFTGIRIGVTIAKVYAWTLNIPISTITSLEAMAISSSTDTIHIPIIDARRGYVYAAIYQNESTQLLKPQHIKLVELKKIVSKYKSYEYISNDIFNDDFKASKYIPNIEKIVNHFKDKENINPHAVNPEYLKLTEAEENYEKNS